MRLFCPHTLFVLCSHLEKRARGILNVFKAAFPSAHAHCSRPTTSGPCRACDVDGDGGEIVGGGDGGVAWPPIQGAARASVPGIWRDEPACGPSSTSSAGSGTRF